MSNFTDFNFGTIYSINYS